MKKRILSTYCRLFILACLMTACGGSDSVERPLLADEKKIGLVLTDFTFEQPPIPSDVACPDGFNMHEIELAKSDSATPEIQRVLPNVPPDLAAFDVLRRLRETNAPDSCDDPTVFRDPSFKTMDAEPAVSKGFNLRRPSAQHDACPRQPFVDAAGGLVDNQLWRVLGCIKGYQRGEVIDEYALSTIREGSRTILMQLSGLDNKRNDEKVTIGIYSSSDPIPRDINGNLVTSASLDVTNKRKFHNVVQGRLVDGVLTAGPFDLRLDYQGQFLQSEYHFRDAHLRLELLPQGGATGLLAGYWDIEDFYDANARQATRAGAITIGFSCPGMHAALHKLADGHPDPKTGECTSISTTFRIKAQPAFVILAEQKADEPTTEK